MATRQRRDGRNDDELRQIEIVRGFTRAAPGSVLLRCGETHVLCTAMIVDGVPEWRAGSGKGWLTAEYDMLPAASPQRKERSRVKLDGRTQEIQRLIGRSLRGAVDLSQLGERTIHLDCDVLQADGGTRTAAVTGAWVALADAMRSAQACGALAAGALGDPVAAVSVGIVDGRTLLDLDYSEDVRAEVDCNLVMNARGAWIECQATGEKGTFSSAQLDVLLRVGESGIRRLFELQHAALNAAQT